MGLGLADFTTDSSTFCQLAKQLLANPPDAFALINGHELNLNGLSIKININKKKVIMKK